MQRRNLRQFGLLFPRMNHRSVLVVGELAVETEREFAVREGGFEAVGEFVGETEG
jgi:hypothetical protein